MPKDQTSRGRTNGSATNPRERVKETRKEQGLPPSVEDPVVLTRIAGLLDRDAEEIDWPEVRRRRIDLGGDR